MRGTCMPSISEEYYPEGDARTLKDAEKIRANPKRLAGALKHVRAEATAAQKVLGKSPTKAPAHRPARASRTPRKK